MIWATVSSWTCFCWLYRASPSFAAECVISLILVLTIWWCPCVESSLVLLEEGVKWTEMGEFNSDDHYIYYWGQESLRRNEAAIMVNKRVQNAVLGRDLQNNRMISLRFQGKPFNITVIQVYAPTTNDEEAEVEWFYEDLQDLLELTPKKEVLFIRRHVLFIPVL